MANTTGVNANSIQNFIGNFKGGLRPNRFRISGEIFGDGGALDTVEGLGILVRSASVPASDLSQIGVPFRGREFKIPGNRTYGTWQFSVLDDSSHGVLWTKFHKWSNFINDHKDNIPKQASSGPTPPAAGNGVTDFTEYMKIWNVKQLDLNGNCVRQVKLIKCWPSVIGEVSFLMDDNDSFSTFTVDLEYQYFETMECTEDTDLT
jgi:hypothetical protein